MDEYVPQYAGFWRRFAAYILDGIAVTFVFNGFANYLWSQLIYLIDDPDLLRVIFYSVTSVWVSLLTWTYFCGMESSPLQATVGKLAVGIYVADVQGQRISFARATGRFFGKLLSGFLMIGYIMAGFSQKRQALHDMIADCLVLWK